MKTTTKFSIIILALVMFQVSCQQSEKSTSAESNTETKSPPVMLPNNPSPPVSTTLSSQIPNELVCMVNDAYMGIKQYPVPVGDKIYYGCCENCVDKLQKSDQFRYAIDPLTKEKVDKVEAYIVRQSDKNYSVFYFKSKENFEKYMREQAG